MNLKPETTSPRLQNSPQKKKLYLGVTCSVLQIDLAHQKHMEICRVRAFLFAPLRYAAASRPHLVQPRLRCEASPGKNVE